MKLADLFPKKYLSASDLKGRQFTLVIASVEMREMRNTETNPVTGKAEYSMIEKPVVYFEGRKPGVVLNKTRTQQLGKALGIDDTDQAAGRSIVLYADGNQLMFRAAKADPKTGEVPTNGQPPE